ncbi:hypothetical protein HNP84_004151 [Thermocatellispora tengchongensis]|uniref:JAB-N domain-containing protein n=1 Tax=Thermocatellispora tengchongensis TaxID=1073253 RepID=A0A840P603_9ACTN|nr:JAB N-terminal domain-containing protein [Thermocatellispora tengchongensis]MBB5134419.1 hypothetical protein [Thermocatellispora tengchongensis]
MNAEPGGQPSGQPHFHLEDTSDGRVFDVAPMMPLVRRALARHLAEDHEVDIELRFGGAGGRQAAGTAHEPAHIPYLDTEPSRVEVQVTHKDATLHSGAYLVRELFGKVMTELAARMRDPDARWGYRLVNVGRDRPLVFRAPALRVKDETLLQVAIRPIQAGQRVMVVVDLTAIAGRLAERMGTIRPTPQVEGSVVVDPKRPRRNFSIRKMEEPELPELDPAAMGMAPEHLTRINVALTPEVHELLDSGLELSGRVEEGGFLAGRVFALGPERHLVRVERVLSAEHTGASFIHFTFTSDSFQALTQALRAGGEGERLVGWWHTHLLGIDVEMGLSETDVILHHGTFRQPWQVAGLINLGRRGRALRFYAATADAMEECALWTIDERDGYRLASPPVGH